MNGDYTHACKIAYCISFIRVYRGGRAIRVMDDKVRAQLRLVLVSRSVEAYRGCVENQPRRTERCAACCRAASSPCRAAEQLSSGCLSSGCRAETLSSCAERCRVASHALDALTPAAPQQHRNHTQQHTTPLGIERRGSSPLSASPRPALLLYRLSLVPSLARPFLCLRLSRGTGLARTVAAARRRSCQSCMHRTSLHRSPYKDMMYVLRLKTRTTESVHTVRDCGLRTVHNFVALGRSRRPSCVRLLSLPACALLVLGAPPAPAPPGRMRCAALTRSSHARGSAIRNLMRDEDERARDRKEKESTQKAKQRK